MPAPSLHALLLLSDSALPLGSFAFSSGLESLLAHKNLSNTHFSSSTTTKSQTLSKFLNESLLNISSTALPYVFSSHRNPSALVELDNDFDASTPCTVARRASITQGRALVQIWERAFAAESEASGATAREITEFAGRLKRGHTDEYGMQLQAHFAPLFGAVCAALGVPEHETAYLFLLNHAKAVLSAAVRASVVGPYQSQAVLASAKLQELINNCIESQIGVSAGVEYAAVTVPTMDLWMGRHELLYSRIFNS